MKERVVALLADGLVKCYVHAMSTVEEIKTAINRLSLEERAEMLAELCGWTDDNWDRQMKADVTTGTFAVLNDKADAAHASGVSLSRW